MEYIYLDNAATTPLLPEVSEAVYQVMRDTFGNPSSTHQMGRKAKVELEQARKTIAAALNCTPKEILFTSGGTEADNLVLRSCQSLGIQRIISSKLEHHAVLDTVEEVCEEQHLKMHLLSNDERGRLDLAELEQVLSDGIPTLVSLMHGNNEIGNLLDLKVVGELCKGHGALFHTDAVQTVGHLPIDLKDLEIDFLAASAHKFHGPKGTGFLYMRSGRTLKSMITGAEQERGFRAGTESIPSIVGMATALKMAVDHLDEDRKKIRAVKQELIQQLGKIEGLRFNGLCTEEEESMDTVVSAILPTKKQTQMFLFGMDMKGVAVSEGSACMSGGIRGSHVIKALYGTLPEGPSIRFSLSKFNTLDEMRKTAEIVKELL